jgi:hypothetical protein
VNFLYPEFSQTRLREDIFEVLKRWQDATVVPPTLTQLHLVHRLRQPVGATYYPAIVEIIRDSLDLLAYQEQRLAQLLRLRYLEGASVFDACRVFNVAESTLYSLQKEAIDRLTQVIWEREYQLRREARIDLVRRLEAPTYEQLIGIDRYLDELFTVLAQPGPPWIVALEGIGGIGKTALADQLMRHTIAQSSFHDFGWVTARQERLGLDGALRAVAEPLTTIEQTITALVAQLTDDDPLYTALAYPKKLAYLETRLKQAPYLIALDNLETAAELEQWLPLLRRFSNPTKFIVTSRRSLHADAGIYHFAMPELTALDALALVRQEATNSNLTLVTKATDTTLQPIYDTVGGNPLALRLIVGQLHFHELAQVLADLTLARGKKAETLYHYIYHSAWQNLAEATRQVWLLLPLLSEPEATLANLVAFSELPDTVVREALEQLVLQNLVICQGTLQERRYCLHSLTRTFLHEQVVQWQT